MAGRDVDGGLVPPRQGRAAGQAGPSRTPAGTTNAARDSHPNTVARRAAASRPLPLAVLDQISDDLDRTVAEGFARARATGRAEERPACRRGCAACCSQLVPLTTLEAQRIADHLSRMPRQERRPIAASVERHLGRFQAWAMQRPPGEVYGREVNLDYLRQRIPCPFLGSENECRIYPVRPLICRGHHALGTSARCETGEQILTLPAVEAETTRAIDRVEEFGAGQGLPGGGGLISTFAPLFQAALGRKGAADAR